jgi:hypothetical protein
MAVVVDIPGFGKVNAQNAAEEATLKELLRVMKGMAKGGGGGAGGAGGGGGGAGGFAGVMEKAGKGVGNFGNEIANTTTVLGDFKRGLASIGGMFTKTIGMATQSVMGLGAELLTGGNRMSDFVKHFPIVGNALGGFVGYLDGQVDTFRSLSEVGASFGNNIVEMNLAAANAGLSMDQFAEFVGQNSEKMLLLGGTVTEGAKQFGQITRQIRNSNKDFMGMGFTMEALNEHTAEYMDQLARQGRLSGMSQEQLRQGSEDYLMQIDRLAKVTGKSRKEAEALLAKQNQEANIIAIQQKLSGEALLNFKSNLAFVDSELPGLSDAVKDLSDGVAQTPLGKILASQVPGFAELQKANAEGTVSQEEYIARMKELMPNIQSFVSSMDPAALQQLMGKEGFDGFLATVGETNKFMTKAYDPKAAAAEADKREKITKALANFEKTIAEIRSTIMTTLIESGLFKRLQDLMGNFLGWFNENSSGIGATMNELFDAFLTKGESLINWIKSLYNASEGETMMDKIIDVGKSVLGTAFSKFGEMFKNWFGNWFKENLSNIILGALGALGGLLLAGLMGAILGPIAAPFLAIGLALGAIFGVDYIKDLLGGAWDKITGLFEWIGGVFGKMGDIIGGLWDKVKSKLNPFNWFGGDDDEQVSDASALSSSSTTAMADASGKIVEEKVDTSMPELKTVSSTAKNQSDSVNNNSNNGMMTALLQEQNTLLRAQLNAMKALQGNLMKGLA